MTNYYDVGKIVNTHGIKGEVRVLSITDSPEKRYKKQAVLTWFKEGESPIELVVRGHRQHKNFDLLMFEEYMSINDVEPLVGGVLKVSEEDLSDLEEDEFYLHEIIGLNVVDEEGNVVGKVKEVISTGANDVWIVQRQNKKDLLLPYIDDVILDVDLEQEKVIVHILEGLDS